MRPDPIKILSPDGPTRAAGDPRQYVRVSTEDQASNGVSLADQERRLLAYCEARAWSVFRIYKDKGVSGRQVDRPALGELLADVRGRRVQAVLVTKLDRLTRSLRDLADLIDLFNRKQVSLVSLGESIDTSNAVGRLLVNVPFAEWLAAIVAEGVFKGLQRFGEVGSVGVRDQDLSGDGARVLNAKQAANLLGLDLRRVYELVKRRELPCVRIGRQIRFRRQALEAWLAQREVQGRDSRGRQDEPSGR